MDPLLIDLPQRIATERLLLRCPQAGDGAVLNAAVCESIDELRPWMPWAQAPPTLDESELYCRRMQARFVARQELTLLVFERDANDIDGKLVGSTGLHGIEWSVPRFEIGYWRRSGCAGRGFMAETVRALNRLAFDRLGARRVEIRMDSRNVRSGRVAERAGFTFEGVLRQDTLDPAGQLRDTRVYSRVRGVEETASINR